MIDQLVNLPETIAIATQKRKIAMMYLIIRLDLL